MCAATPSAAHCFNAARRAARQKPQRYGGLADGPPMLDRATSGALCAIAAALALVALASTPQRPAAGGVGPSLAQRIVDDRATHGAFANIDALLRVRGVGPHTLERLRDLLLVTTTADHAEQGRAP
jgi:competence ComEA-like helix-hairpin-helix protein